MIKDIQDGRSMLEMLGVLSIVGVLTVGGFGLVNKVNNSNQANNVIDEISGLASKVRIVARDYYSCFSDDSSEAENTEACGSFMSYISKAKAYPDTLECEGEECSEFLGSADVTYTVNSAVYPGLFSITVNNLTDEMCMNLVTANWGSVSTTGFAGITGVGDERNFSACNGNNDNGSLTLNFR